MAKKKKEEQNQDAAIPAEDTVASEGEGISAPGSEAPRDNYNDPEHGGDTAMTDGEAGPDYSEGVEGAEALPDASDFPADDGAPFEAIPDEADVVPDSIPSEDAEPDGERTVTASDGEDYASLLQEVGSGEPTQDIPLSLSDEGEGAQDTDGEGDPPLMPDDGGGSYEDAAVMGEPDMDSAGQDNARPAPRGRPAIPQRGGQVLTINARDHIQTEQEREEIIWHEVRNAYRTRRMLAGTLDGLERTASGKTLAVVDYKGFRVAIPLKEMLFMPNASRIPSGAEYVAYLNRLYRNLTNMLGAEIDFIVKGIDSNTHSIVASRKDAMLRKRQIFYMNTDELGAHRIYEGRVVEARVIAVAEKVVRVEVFGVECAIVARDLSWEWLGDAREHFHVGDRKPVRVLTIDRSSVEDLSITADFRSVSATTNVDNVKKCQRQCRYVGRVTDVRSGVVYIRLNNGVNAIAHACYDMRTPGKKDDVSFAVTQLDEEKGIAIGIITRIIKQNL